MSLTTRVGLLAGASVLTLTGVGAAATPTEGTNNEARIAALEAEVARLKGDSTMHEQRNAEIRALVADVLADADTRASLLSQGMTAGYDGGFMIGSNDGNFSLKINGQIQTRFVFQTQDIPGANSRTETDWGVEMRRTKIGFSGHIVDRSWKYRVLGAYSRMTGNFQLDEAYVEKSMDGGWSLRVGHFKAPFLREELVSSTRQLAVERSLVNERFNQDRSRGIQFGYEADQMRFAAMLNTGHGGSGGTAWGGDFPGNSGTYGDWLAGDREFGISARLDWLVAGAWNQMGDFTSAQGSDYGCMIGVAVAYDGDGDGLGNNADRGNVFAATVDATVKGDGWNVYAAGIWYGFDGTAAGADRDEIAFVLQGGVYLSEDWELFGRFEWGDVDVTGSEDLMVLTVGVNKYWAKHNAKWTTDIGIGLNEVQAPWASRGAGWLTDSANEDGQIVFRSQLQLAF
ncbi:MAG: hypothetical protein KF817_13550 [Phycisphaeraceae bacterium]|nr:hypothetical protein [Phycisphaeraceae bacterium]